MLPSVCCPELQLVRMDPQVAEQAPFCCAAGPHRSIVPMMPPYWIVPFSVG